jgi:hypothetical protein
LLPDLLLRRDVCVERDVPLAEPEMLERLSRRSGAIFKPLGSYAGRSKDEDPLDRWASENPLL